MNLSDFLAACSIVKAINHKLFLFGFVGGGGFFFGGGDVYFFCFFVLVCFVCLFVL